MRRFVKRTPFATHIPLPQIIHQDENKIEFGGFSGPSGKGEDAQQDRKEDLFFHFLEPQITLIDADYKTKNLRSSASSAVKTGFHSFADLLDALGFAVGFGDARVKALGQFRHGVFVGGAIDEVFHFGGVGGVVV